MNKDGHVWNALLLAIGIGVILEPALNLQTLERIAEVSIPIVLGALFPDVDTAFGKHRKTLHNFAVLGIVAAYPFVFDNLAFVWIGVLTHYVLDILGSMRGLALFYPLSASEFNVPIGVPVDSKYANAMMLAVTGFELTVATLIVYRIPQRLLETGLAAAGLL